MENIYLRLYGGTQLADVDDMRRKNNVSDY